MAAGFKLISIFFICFSIASCGQRSSEVAGNDDRGTTDDPSFTGSLSESETAFLGNLSTLCGRSFRGAETYSAPGRESWASKDFVMHVTLCEDDRVHIPFHLDEDRSRTWMFLVENQGLRFRHDHRHEDGTPEEITMYGGYSDGEGTEFEQRFPADEYTINLLTDTLGREWRIILAEDLSSMKYQLHYSEELMFEAEFDLTSPF